MKTPRIDYASLSSMRAVPFEGEPLLNAIDNAGMTLWMGFGPGYSVNKGKLANLAADAGMKLDDAALEKTMGNMMSFSGRVGNPREHLQDTFSPQQLQSFLSLEHHLLPESEAHSRRAIEEGLKYLKLEPVASLPEVQKELPGLLASIDEFLSKPTVSVAPVGGGTQGRGR